MQRTWPELIKSADEWARTKPFVCLVVHFFKRFFSGDALSTESDLRLGIGGILALLAAPGVVLPILLFPKYSTLFHWMMGIKHFDLYTASIPDKYMLLTFTMAITGIVAVVKWEALFPDRLDYATLAPLPVGARNIFLAKFTALMFFLGLFVLALNAVSSFLFPSIVMGSETSGALWLRFVIAHAVATISGGFFMFFFFCALMGLLMTLLPYRRFRQISTAVQFVLVIALVMLLLFTPEIGSLTANASPRTRALLEWLPTMWFLGLYQQIFGHADSAMLALAARALQGLAIAFTMSLLFYVASYARYFRRIPEMLESGSRSSDPQKNPADGKLQRLAARCFARLPLSGAFERACFIFTVKTLARSQRHGLFLAGFAGLGMAIAIQDVASDWGGTSSAASHLPGVMLLSAPLAISFSLLTGLRFVFNMPADLRANWAFRMIPEDKGIHARRVAKVLMLSFLAPVIIVTFVIFTAIWGARIGVVHTVFVLVASLLLAEALLVAFRKIPFACSYATGKHHVGIALMLYLLLFLSFSSGLASIEYAALAASSVIAFITLAAFAAVCWLGVHYYETEFTTNEGALIFEDEPDAVVPSMDLR
jgi:hypothetical protein